MSGDVRTKSALRVDDDEVHAVPSRRIVIPRDLTKSELNELLVEHLGRRSSDEFGQMLDSHSRPFVPASFIARRIGARLRDSSQAQQAVLEFKQSMTLSAASARTLDRMAEGYGGLGSLNAREIRDVVIRELGEDGYRVIKDYVDEDGKKYGRAVFPRPSTEAPSSGARQRCL